MSAKKGFLLGTIVMLGSLVVSPALAADDVIRLGVPGAHTGDVAGYGLPALNAAKLVVDKVNAEGGINGKKVVLIPQDDQCKPELSTNAATKLISEKVDIVMGHTCSGATKASLGIYDDKKIIVISPSATAAELTQDRKYPYFFRTTPSDDAQALLGVDFAIQALGAKKIAILHDKQDYGKMYAEFAKQFIEKDGRAQVVFFDGITAGAVDYSATVQRIGRSGADTLLFGGYYPEASKLVMLIKARKMNINFVSEDGVKVEPFIELAGKDSEGVYASSSRDYADKPISIEALESHRKMFNAEPGSFFYQSYAATQALLNAVKIAGTTDADALAAVLRKEVVNTPIGDIHFDDKGDVVGAGFAMYKVVDGKFVDQNFQPEKTQ